MLGQPSCKVLGEWSGFVHGQSSRAVGTGAVLQLHLLLLWQAPGHSKPATAVCSNGFLKQFAAAEQGTHGGLVRAEALMMQQQGNARVQAWSRSPAHAGTVRGQHKLFGKVLGAL
jgi:hypothetical protein